MHDIGKMAIPDKILNKPGKLDSDEMAIMKEHAYHGYHQVAVKKIPVSWLRLPNCVYTRSGSTARAIPGILRENRFLSGHASFRLLTLSTRLPPIVPIVLSRLCKRRAPKSRSGQDASSIRKLCGSSCKCRTTSGMICARKLTVRLTESRVPQGPRAKSARKVETVEGPKPVEIPGGCCRAAHCRAGGRKPVPSQGIVAGWFQRHCVRIADADCAAGVRFPRQGEQGPRALVLAAAGGRVGHVVQRSNGMGGFSTWSCASRFTQMYTADALLFLAAPP